jgi:hypothetical protein
MFRSIHIGSVISKRLHDLGMNHVSLANRLKIGETECQDLLSQADINTKTLLRISKVLKYDFFRFYSMNLLLYAPPSMGYIERKKIPVSGNLPVFNKNTYTREVIRFILKEIKTGNKSAAVIIKEYNIPKTTLYRWIKKYQR